MTGVSYEDNLARLRDFNGGWNFEHSQQAYERLYSRLVNHGIYPQLAAQVLIQAYCAARADKP